MTLINFNSEHLYVDGISFNIQNLNINIEPNKIALNLSKHFNSYILLNDRSIILFHDPKKKYKVFIRQYTKSQGHWSGTKIIFSGKDAAYFYKLLKTQRFNWDFLKFNQQSLHLDRIKLCYSRSKIQNYTTICHIRFRDFPERKRLKVNRINNSLNYRVYQKNQSVCFGIELKYRETKLVQAYLFQNQLDLFEYQLVIRYFKCSKGHFVKLAIQNYKLIKSNESLNYELKRVESELNMLKQEQKEKISRKKARTIRERLPKREPMTSKIYNLLLKAVASPTYRSVRLRIALCLLTVTGIQLKELLHLKVSQCQTLIKNHWVRIDRLKSGSRNYKAILTREGRKVMEERRKDFDFLFRIKSMDSYIFTSELNHKKMLSRETITRDINWILRSVSKSLRNQPNITSHSFRVGYIYQLWQDPDDIEFVKQSIGNRKMASTSSYVKELGDA